MRRNAIKNVHYRCGSARFGVVLAVATIGLAGVAAALWALSPTPLTPDAVRSLSATTTVSVETSRQPAAWRRVEILLSGTESGDAASLAGGSDVGGFHFVVGNGRGLGDGEVQVTPLWDRQEAGAVGEGIVGVLVVASDEASVTATQRARLDELLSAVHAAHGVTFR